MKKTTKLLALLLAIFTLVSAMAFPAAAGRRRIDEAKGCRKVAEETIYNKNGDVTGKYVYEYDDAGRTTRFSEYDYDSTAKALKESYRQTFSFNANGDPLTETTEHPDSSEPHDWYITQKYEYSYDSNGKLTGYTVARAANAQAELKISSRYDYAYEGDTRIETYSSVNDGVATAREETRETFDANGNVILEIEYLIDGSGEKTQIGKYEREFDKNGNMTLERFLDEDEPENETRYTYNDNGDTLSETRYNYHSDLSGYIPNNRQTWTYDEQYRLIEEYRENYFDEAWHPADRRVYTYFEDFPEKMEHIYCATMETYMIVASDTSYEWDDTKNDLVIDDRNVYTMSDDKLSIECVYSRYNSETDKVEERDRYSITAADNSYSEVIYKNYNLKENVWEEEEDDRCRYTLTFDDANNVTSMHDFRYNTSSSVWEPAGSFERTYTEAKYHAGIVKVDATNSSCDANGHKAYYTCECGHEAYTDEKGINKIENLDAWLASEGKVDLLAHEYDANGVCLHCGALKPAPEKKGLSAGAVIGIVAGSLVLLALIAYVALFFVWKKKEALPEALAFLGFLSPSYRKINDKFFAKKESESENNNNNKEE